MNDYILKNFRIKCSLKDKKTGKWAGVREIISQGYNGANAVSNLNRKLAAEGKYEIDIEDTYTYFEIGPAKI